MPYKEKETGKINKKYDDVKLPEKLTDELAI